MAEPNSQRYKDILKIGSSTYEIFSLSKASKVFGTFDYLPFSLKIILENLLRNLDHKDVHEEQIEALLSHSHKNHNNLDIFYKPARVLMQDFTGVPAVVDLAAMRQAAAGFNLDPSIINPLSPVDLVIDHSVSVDKSGFKESFNENVLKEEVLGVLDYFKFKKFIKENL